jgi:hypothetical protein
MDSFRTAWIATLGTALCVGCSPLQQGLPYAPIFNTGARATIISPGQNAPLMPGQHAPGTPGATYPTSQSGSYSGMPGAPPALPPGSPPSAYGSPYGNPNDISMIGGAVTVDTRDVKRPRNALSGNPLLWPFAVVTWPLAKLADALDGEDDQALLDRRAQHIVDSGGAPTYLGQGGRQQQQLAQENATNEAMQRELAMRQDGAGAPGAAPQTTSALAASRPSGGMTSIASELAALRERQAAQPMNVRNAALPGSTAAAGASDVEDRDGDGRPDLWRYERDGKLVREVFDDDADGTPDRTVHYEPGSKRIARVEQDDDGDGQTDTWVIYENGKMNQRRADTNHDGQVDAWTFYDGNGQITRQAQDLDGDGTRDRAEVFENGKLARRTEDLDGDGRPDRSTRFDAKGQALETEEDKDGDGQIDVRSYYADGRLVKRQILGEEAQEATP